MPTEVLVLGRVFAVLIARELATNIWYIYSGYWPEYLRIQNLSNQDWLIVLLCFILSWILYEKPNFEGHSIPLEEGELELSGLWDIEDVLERSDDEAESAKPVVIGSIRLVVQVGKISKLLIKANWISSVLSANIY